MGPRQHGRTALRALAILAVCMHTTYGQIGGLQELRGSARRLPPPPQPPAAPAPTPPCDHDCGRDRHDWSWWGDSDDDDDDAKAEAAMFGLLILGAGITAPWWGPPVVLGDDYSLAGYFPDFPYDDAQGYMQIDTAPSHCRVWSGRFRAEYVDTFDDLRTTGGHLLLATTSRIGIESEWNWREEGLPGNASDQLWTGDCNIVYRFAQTEHVQMRTGLGVNWLADEVGSDTGFNFTYGADVFPVRPIVLSSTLDWGQVGNSTLFHIRATAGVIANRFEVYTGYDYYDVGNAQIDGLIGGVRFWF